MRSGPIVHGALLAVALGVAWQTWTRDRTEKPRVETVTVWPGGEVQKVTLHAKLRDVTVERRDGYYWGKVEKTTPPPPQPAAPDAGVEEEVSVPEPKAEKTTVEFPVGEDGEKAIAKLAPLEAMRALSGPADGAEYGLGEDADRLAVTAGGTTRELIIGGKVFGEDHRYVRDVATGKAYVVSGDVLRAFDAPEFALRERKLHAYPPADVAKAVIRRGDKSREVVRAEAPPSPHGRTAWADAASPDKVDQTLANFMDRVDQLLPIDYASPPDEASLTPVAVVEYKDKGGNELGKVELMKRASAVQPTPGTTQPAAAAARTEYFVRSERTRGLAKVSVPAGERVDQDVAQIVP